MKKYTGLSVVCILLIGGMLAGFYYLSTHDVFQTKKTVTITKSSETTGIPETSENNVSLNETTSDGEDSSDNMKAIEAIGDIEAETNKDHVLITIPYDLVGDMTQEQVDAAIANEDGYLEGTLNEDGSVTYVMTAKKYGEVVQSMQDGIEESLQEIIDDPEIEHITAITHNEDFSEYTVLCNSNDLNLNESMVALQLYIFSGTYYKFLVDPPEIIYVKYINTETGEVFYDKNSTELWESSN